VPGTLPYQNNDVFLKKVLGIHKQGRRGYFDEMTPGQLVAWKEYESLKYSTTKRIINNPDVTPKPFSLLSLWGRTWVSAPYLDVQIALLKCLKSGAHITYLESMS
jgi:hypothetical protein